MQPIETEESEGEEEEINMEKSSEGEKKVWKKTWEKNKKLTARKKRKRMKREDKT